MAQGVDIEGKCFGCRAAEIAKQQVGERWKWWSEGNAHGSGPFHFAKWLSDRQAPESAGNLSGTLRIVSLEAACGKRFDMDIDTGD